eukprot:860055_1
MATIRMDGFAGLTNKVKGNVGNVKTHLLTVDGRYLCVTIDIYESNLNGSVKVGFNQINGFELTDSNVVEKNVTDYIMSWKSGNDLSKLIGNNVVIEFELMDA